MKDANVILIGCGELGSRHLQALAALPIITRVTIVDPNPESHALGKHRLGGAGEKHQHIRFSWTTAIPAGIGPVDLCVVATHAKIRPSILREVFQATGCTKFVLEKMVSQSEREYVELLDFVADHKLSVWVNCQTRTYDIYQYIKSIIRESGTFSMQVNGGNRGLACVGIHYVDLFVYLADADSLSCDGAIIDNVLHPSRRAKDIFKLSGVLAGRSSAGSVFRISYSQLEMGPDILCIMTPRHNFVVDACNQLSAFESSAETAWQWKRIDRDERYLVSVLGRKFYTSILEGSDPGLPTLQQCFPAHAFIFQSLLPHFNKLLHKESDACPVA